MHPCRARIVGVLLLATAALGGAEGLAAATEKEARVFVLGVDGASWNVIDAMTAAGELPHLAALMARGASARLATVEPVTSPVVWTSIATGRSPSAHGVTDFFATRLDVRVASAYERLAADGVRVGLYDVLMTWPPLDLPGGFVIPGWLRRDPTVTPPDVWARAGTTPYVNAYDRARSDRDYLELARRDVARKPERFRSLTRAFDLQLAAMTLYAPDMTSHRFWHAAHPEEFDGDLPAEAEEFVSAIAEAYRGVDRAVGVLDATLGPRDTLLVLSDHGFRARGDGIRNVWVTHADEELRAAGFDETRDRFALVSAFGTVALRIHPASDDSPESVAERDDLVRRLVDWLESYRAPDGRSAFRAVEFVDGEGRPASAPRPWLVRLRQAVVRGAVRWFFGTQIRGYSHAVVFGLPDDDVLSSLWPDGEISAADRRLPVSRAFTRERFSGEHDPTGVFIAAGGPVAPQPDRGDVSVLDVAPLLFYLTGRGVPDDLEGRLPQEILRPETLVAHPPRTVEAASLPGLAIAGSAGAGPGESSPGDELVEKLRALGYVE